MKYRKKPVMVEAFQLTDDPEMIAPKWFTQAVADESVWIDRSIVDGHARIYGCTISAKDGRIYPCSRSVFQRNYEKAGGAA